MCVCTHTYVSVTVFMPACGVHLALVCTDFTTYVCLCLWPKVCLCGSALLGLHTSETTLKEFKEKILENEKNR